MGHKTLKRPDLIPSGDNIKLMKGQRCDFSQMASVIWHYCNFNPPSETAGIAKLSRQSVSKIYVKLGMRLRQIIPDEFLALFLDITWDSSVEDYNESGKFDGDFYKKLTQSFDYYVANYENERDMTRHQMWFGVLALHEGWNGVPKETLDVHISVALFRSYVVFETLAMRQQAEENGTLDQFFEGMELYHPDFPRTVEGIKNFNLITGIKQMIIIKDLYQNPLK